MKSEPKPLETWQIDDAQRLKSLFDQREPKISQADFGSQFEVGSQGMVWQYLAGKRPLNIKAAVAFARGLRVSVAAISPTIAAQISQASETVGDVDIAGLRRVTSDEDLAPPSVAIPMVSMHVRAGISGYVPDFISGDQASLHVPRMWLEENDLNERALVAVKIKGDSMQTTMFDGDIAVVNTADLSRKNGGVFALNYNGEAVIKRLKYERREWYLVSDNPEYKPAPCRGAECIVIGRVVRFEPINFRDRL